MPDQEWNATTDEKFDQALARVINDQMLGMDSPAEWILSIPGVYEILSEDFNNEALDEMKNCTR